MSNDEELGRQNIQQRRTQRFEVRSSRRTTISRTGLKITMTLWRILSEDGWIKAATPHREGETRLPLPHSFRIFRHGTSFLYVH
jgi:hypothetical protein